MIELTSRAQIETRKTNIEPQIVLEIEGIDTVFSAVEILKFIRIGDPELYIGNAWKIGGLNAVADQEQLISLQGTSTTIQQQLRPDQGSVNSVSSLSIQLLDKDELMTRIISPGVVVPEILARRATVWLGFRNTAWKEDYVRIFSGIIDDVVSGAGFVSINVSHPDQKKRQTLFSPRKSTISSAIDNLVTSIPITNANDLFLVPVLGPDGLIDDSLRYYVKIDDEIIRYTGATATHLTGCTRGELDSVASSHDLDANAESFYKLEGAMVDLSLKLMMSGKNGYCVTDKELESFNVISPLSVIQDTIFFKGVNVEDEYGIVAGDYITTTGALNAANNVTLKDIGAVVVTNDGSYIVVNGVTFVDETDSAATISFRSQYDTLGIGCGMSTQDVDVLEHHYWRDLVLNTYQYRFYIKDEINAKDFIDQQLYAPYGAYSIPRKAKSSMGYHIGPIPRGEIPILSKDSIKSPGKMKLRRTITRNFANTVIYSYDQDSLQDKFLSGRIRQDADSRNRIDVGVKAQKHEAEGLRTDLNAANNIDIVSERVLGRYKYAAEFFEGMTSFFKASFNAEPGDLVLLDLEDLQVSDTQTGSRDKLQKFYEVTNKSTDLKTGDVKIDVTDTAYDTNERYGIISPSSVIVSGTTTYAYIDDSYGELYPGNEPKKWEQYVGLPVLIHNEDYSFQEEILFVGFDPSDRYKMLFGGALSIPVTAGMIVDIPQYSASDSKKVNRRYKLFHPHYSPIVSIVSGASNTVFDVGAGDVSKFQVGFPARVHNDDFSVYSSEVLIQDVTGTTITVSADLGFTPTSSQFVQLLGFPDGEPCYRWI